MIERRSAQRFQVGWPILVEGGTDSDVSFVESGVLRNISSQGAMVAIPKKLSTGTQLDIYIQLPLAGKKWMRYPASVVRTETGVAAVKFDSPRPDFGVTVVSV